MHRFFFKQDSSDHLRARINSVVKRGDMIKLAIKLKGSECIDQESKDEMFATLMDKWIARANIILLKHKEVIKRTIVGGGVIIVPLEIDIISLQDHKYKLQAGIKLMLNVYMAVKTTFNVRNDQRKRLYNECVDNLLRQASEFLSSYDSRFMALGKDKYYLTHGRVVWLKPINEIPFMAKVSSELDMPMRPC
jgi:hypothetical protein